MSKTLILTFAADTAGPFTPTIGVDTFEITDYALPKSFIASFEDDEDYLTVVRWNADDTVWESVTDGKGDAQLNVDRKDVTVITPDIYGVIPKLPNNGVIKVWIAEV